MNDAEMLAPLNRHDDGDDAGRGYHPRAMQVEPIVIVGGGPAGATVAATLARAGREVALIERRADTQSKCCGWCLAPRAIPTLERIALKDAVVAAASGSTRRWRLHDPAGAVLLDESLGASAGLIVDRARMDAALRARARDAGATVVEGAATVTGDWRIANRARGVELTAGLVIGADGVGSGIARAFGLSGVAPSANGRASPGDAARRRGTPPRAAPRRYGISWSIPTELGDSMDVPEESIEIHLAREGYLGLVRSDDRVVVAALIDRDRTVGASSPLEVIRRWARQSAAMRPLEFALPCGDASSAPTARASAAEASSAPAARGRAADASAAHAIAAPMHATGPLPWRPSKIALAQGAAAPHAPGVALVGDAAGYEEPFTGEGMALAFESAELLARHVLARKRWDDAAAAHYASEHRERFDRGRRRVRALAGIGALASRRASVASLVRAGGFIPFVPGAIVRSVVAA